MLGSMWNQILFEMMDISALLWTPCIYLFHSHLLPGF